MTDDPEITDPRDPYKRCDIVTELDRQLLHWHEPMLQRARDEIVALRKLTDGDWVWKQITSTRNDALEEAARACERRGDETGPQEAYAVLDIESYTSACGGCAYDIRALKDKCDE